MYVLQPPLFPAVFSFFTSQVIAHLPTRMIYSIYNSSYPLETLASAISQHPSPVPHQSFTCLPPPLPRLLSVPFRLFPTHPRLSFTGPPS